MVQSRLAWNLFLVIRCVVDWDRVDSVKFGCRCTWWFAEGRQVGYGTLDQERASSELRSLQRIRQVHHPFLLSLERIEVVNQQIVIVTELAECSLVERFQYYRGKGLPGIPRDVLIDFLRDAADALDFLSQKHELQHLDVKPGNLLIVADRIKVADFGLVKDLHEQNQSLVGGLTPTYAAPEIFDGRPDRRSDQYSLAIVYQELLTGQMPFTGRTTAELARQHLNQSPDLESLPPADRPIIARRLRRIRWIAFQVVGNWLISFRVFVR